MMEFANITSIYKGKGEKNDLQNERGIFGINILRSLLLKIIYNDEYEKVDANMSDSNVGGRKRKNIRNHLFIVNGIINESIIEKNNVDIEILDYKQCFDSMWLDETINDLYEAGLDNNNLNVIYNLNEKNKVAVVTPHGLTERVNIEKIVMQGENLAPLECSVQVDTFGKECLKDGKYLFFYRGTVPVPPLSMVDDLLCISVCGIESVMMNSFINAKSSIKKLQFGESKCHKLHIGRDSSVCPALKIDKWKVKKNKEMENNKSSLEDIHDGVYNIEDTSQEKYLGDFISSCGKNDKNIAARIKKGYGIIKQVSSILEEVCFGKYFFTVAKILRDSLFINSILLNSEAWYSLSKSNIEDLEKLDNILLRKFLEAGSSVPTVMLHLELGTLPIRFILITRRLMFLHYILQEDEQSLMNKFLIAQIEETKEGDWWLTVKDNMEELNLELSLHEIKLMSKNSFKMKVKKSAEQQAFKWLNKKKAELKKVKSISHVQFKMEKYLSSPILSVDQTKFLFHLRTKMLFLRTNYRNMQKDDYCPLCANNEEKELDNQQHLLQCKMLCSVSDIQDKKVCYDDIFSNDLCSQAKVTILLESKYKQRKLMEEQL